MNLKLGISTCPNDTFIFGALINGQVDSRFKFESTLLDVQELNTLAIEGIPDIVKVSYGVIPAVKDKYAVLDAGGALGFGCGPLLVAKEKTEINKLKKVAIPGKNTSAFRFFKHFFGENFEFVELRFDLIMPAVISGEVDAGLVIHEGRFIYQNSGLVKLVDLGEIWEEKYNAPIPLGAILMKRELADIADEITADIVNSINYAENNYSSVYSYIKKYAQEMDDTIIKSHIDLYVNEYSKSLLGARKAVMSFLDLEEKDFF